MIALVVAMSRNRIIGNQGRLPWQGQMPADMAHFKSLTTGQAVVMGRKTWESLPPKFRPLPNRANIVVSRRLTDPCPGAALMVPSDEMLWDMQHTYPDMFFVIGGGEVYRLFLPYADLVYATLIDAAFEGDTDFPELSETEWVAVDRQDYPTDENNCYPYSFLTYKRRQSV